MNCKPGDIATIIAPPGDDRGYHGKLVSVLHAAPSSMFRLPDGQLAFSNPGDWVCESLGSPFEAFLYAGPGGACTGRRTAMFATINDKRLRPIRDPGDDAVDEISARKPVERDLTLTPKRQLENC